MHVENLYTASGSSPPVATAPRTVRVALCGVGTVGRALCAQLAAAEAELAGRGLRFEIPIALVRDLRRDRPTLPAGTRRTDDPAEVLRADVDVLVELIGGTDAARALVEGALARGIPVVTANKALIAEHGEALRLRAARERVALRYEASVAAGIPILALLDRALVGSGVHQVDAILNGTSNFVLGLVAAGWALDAAVAEAQRRGFAEADPSLDLSGRDAAHKLVVVAASLGARLAERDVEVEGIERITPAIVATARDAGFAVRSVARLALGASPHAWVAPTLVPLGHPLASVDEEQNGIVVHNATLPRLFLSGPGAGGEPTAQAVLDDLVGLGDEPRRATRPLDVHPARTPFAVFGADVPAALVAHAGPGFARTHALRRRDLSTAAVACRILR